MPVATSGASCIPKHHSGLVFISSVGASPQWIPPLHFREHLPQFCHSANPHPNLLQLQKYRGRSALVAGSTVTPKEDVYPTVLHSSSCQRWFVPWQSIQLQRTSQSGCLGSLGCGLTRAGFSGCTGGSCSSATCWPCCLAATRCHAVATQGVLGNSGTSCNYGLSVGFTQRLAF